MVMQIKGKFVQNATLDSSKILLKAGEALRILAQDGTEKRLIELNSEGKVLANGAEVALKSDIASTIASIESSLAAEVAARGAADSILDGKITTEKNRAEAAESALQSAIAAEEARAMAAEASVRSEFAAADATLAANLAAESAARDAGDTSTLNSAKAYADQKVSDLVNGAPAMLDTLKELADAINSDAGFATTVANQIGQVSSNLSNEVSRATAAEATLSAAVSAEQSRAESAETALSNRITAEESARAAAVSAEESRALAAEAALSAGISAEAAARAASEASLDARLDVLEADPVTKAYVDGKVADITGDMVDLDGYAQDVRSDLDQEILDRAAADSAEQANRIAGDAAVQAALTAEVANRSAAISAEAASRAAADGVLDVKIDQKHSEALSYTDAKVAALVNSAPGVLDTLKELADALGGDANFATTVASQIANAANDLGDRFRYEQFVVDAAMISAGYMELGFKAFAASMVVSNGRLMMFEGEDYSVSVVGGKSRLTFMGSMLPGEAEALEIGDVLKVKYLKDVR